MPESRPPTVEEALAWLGGELGRAEFLAGTCTPDGVIHRKFAAKATVIRLALDLARKGAEAPDHITTLALCEQRSLVLRPGLTYRFEPIDGCEACAGLLADGALEVEAEAAMNEAHARWLTQDDVEPEVGE